MSKSGHHVVPAGGKWTVRRSGGSRASAVFDTQREALDDARDKARRDGGELYVHGRDGRIRERNSYGRDPHPPRG